MKKYSIYKEFSNERTMDELQFNLTFYKSQLELLAKEMDFFKHLMTSKSYDQKVPNIFETFEMFKKQIEESSNTQERLLRDISQHCNDVRLKLECDDLACDDYFIRRNYDMELEVVDFLMKTAKLSSEIMEYLKGIIV